MNTSRHKIVGWALIAAGVIGVLTGIVPLTTNALRILVDEDLWHVVDLAAHGVEAMGLSVEWGMLSSAMGTCLGAMLLCAGVGWRGGRPWATAVSWAYVFAALAVNGTDMIIFLFRARPGPMRTQMLVFDGIATLFPLLVAGWLIRRRPRVSDGPDR